MPHYLVRLGTKIIDWSTIVDAPVAVFDGEDDVRKWTQDEFGREGLRGLPGRLARLADKGTSSRIHLSAEDVCSVNRAGADETCMTFAQLVAYYGTDRESYADSRPRRQRGRLGVPVVRSRHTRRSCAGGAGRVGGGCEVMETDEDQLRLHLEAADQLHGAVSHIGHAWRQSGAPAELLHALADALVAYRAVRGIAEPADQRPPSERGEADAEGRFLAAQADLLGRLRQADEALNEARAEVAALRAAREPTDPVVAVVVRRAVGAAADTLRLAVLRVALHRRGGTRDVELDYDALLAHAKAEYDAALMLARQLDVEIQDAKVG